MFKCIWAPLLAGVAALSSAATDEPRYHIGRLATAEDIRAAGISVAPDGTGLPPGSGTAIQGRPIYEAACAACHGSRGEGNASYPALVGGRGTLKNDRPILTVGSYWPYATTVWDYINRAMPYQNPGSLTTKQVYAVTAYVLFMNKVVGERAELNESTLAKVRMPNRDGFTSDPRPDVKSQRTSAVAVPYGYGATSGLPPDATSAGRTVYGLPKSAICLPQSSHSRGASSGQLSTFVRARQSGNWGQDSELRPLPPELLIVGDHEVSPVVNDSVGNCTGHCSLAGNRKPVRSTSWLHRSIPSRPILNVINHDVIEYFSILSMGRFSCWLHRRDEFVTPEDFIDE